MLGDLLTAYQRCLRFEAEVVLIDEAVFSQTTVKPYTWARQKTNVVASAFWKSEPAAAVCAAVSEARGLICY